MGGASAGVANSTRETDRPVRVTRSSGVRGRAPCARARSASRVST